MDKLKVKDREDLVRDTYSKAILSADLQKLQEHRQKKQFFKDLVQQKEQINSLKQEIGEIKDLLKQILKREN